MSTAITEILPRNDKHFEPGRRPDAYRIASDQEALTIAQDLAQKFASWTSFPAAVFGLSAFPRHYSETGICSDSRGMYNFLIFLGGLDWLPS
jgi:hypothetical protein